MISFLLALGISLAPKVALAAVVVWWFVREERAGRRASSTLVILGLVVVDAALFPAVGTTNGLLRPTLLGRELALPVLLTPMALLARLLVGPLLHRPRAVLLPWLMLCSLMAVGAVGGLAAGHDSGLVSFELLALVNVGAVALLVAGVPAGELLHDRALPRLARWAAVVAGALLVTDSLGLVGTVDLKLIEVFALGKVGADVATLFATLGIVAIALELATPVRRRRQLWAGVVLLAAPVVAGQRASLIGVAVSLAVLAVCWWWLRGRRVFTLRLQDVLVPGLVVGIGLCLLVIVTQTTGTALPGGSLVEQLGGTGKAQSAQSRINQWHAAWALVQLQPVFGYGLGTVYVHFEEGFNQFWTQGITHNVLLDLALRLGLLGVVSFVAAVAGSVSEVVGAVRRVPREVAALAVAAAAATGGLLARGMVESILEKHRLAVLLGVLVGVMYTCASERSRPAAPSEVTVDGPSHVLTANER